MRILVVEHENRLADSLRAGLRAEGYAVDVARNGTDGLWLARGTPTPPSCSTSSCPG